MCRGEDVEGSDNSAGAAHALALPVPESYLPRPRVGHGGIPSHDAAADRGSLGPATGDGRAEGAVDGSGVTEHERGGGKDWRDEGDI